MRGISPELRGEKMIANLTVLNGRVCTGMIIYAFVQRLAGDGQVAENAGSSACFVTPQNIYIKHLQVDESR